MAEVRADAQGATAVKGGAPTLRPRPLSPHLQVWRWHVTMAASIATRATGVALYGGALIAAVWALCLASGPEAYARFEMVMGSPLGWLVFFGLAVSIFYHLAAGVRHLVWDSGRGFLPKTANTTAWAAFAFGVVAALAAFAVYFPGRALSMAGQGGVSYRTPLRRARGLGAAHSGVSGFIAERVTSIALAPLSLWAVWAVLSVAPGGYDGAVAFLQSPIEAALAALTLLVSVHHMHIGMRVVVEDYVHDHGRRIGALLLNTAACGLIAAIGTVAILKVAFSTPLH